MTRLLCVGEAMAEIRFTAEGPVFGYGGDSFNTAVYAARALGGGVRYLTRIGTDPLSDGLVELARREALPEGDLLRDPEREIGIYAVRTDSAGERSFHYWRDRSAARRLFAVPDDLDRLRGAEIVYLSGITLAILAPSARSALRARLAALRDAGTRIAFDSNYRPQLWEDAATARAEIAALWALTDIALPSLDDELALFGGDEAGTLARLRSAGCRHGAIKRGAAGPLPLAGIPCGPFAAAPRVVDATAAGDSFNGAYLAASLRGLPEERCLLAGHTLAAQVVTRPGALT